MISFLLVCSVFVLLFFVLSFWNWNLLHGFSLLGIFNRLCLCLVKYCLRTNWQQQRETHDIWQCHLSCLTTTTTIILIIINDKKILKGPIKPTIGRGSATIDISMWILFVSFVRSSQKNNPKDNHRRLCCFWFVFFRENNFQTKLLFSSFQKFANNNKIIPKKSTADHHYPLK